MTAIDDTFTLRDIEREARLAGECQVLHFAPHDPELGVQIEFVVLVLAYRSGWSSEIEARVVGIFTPIYSTGIDQLYCEVDARAFTGLTELAEERAIDAKLEEERA